MTPLDEIGRDLDWRESELALLRIMLSNDSVTDRQKLVLFRAGWALLYAHFEGFCKFCLTVYYDSLQKLLLKNRQLSIATQAFSLNNELKLIRNLPAVDLITNILKFQDEVMEKCVSFPDVDTESNLWPDTLRQLLDDADISIESLEAHNRTLATLVSRRNKIAHGEKDMITEYSYYIRFEEAAKAVMYDLAFAVDAKIAVHK